MESKNVIVIATDSPSGLAANAAAVLGVTLGHTIRGLVGADLRDADGVTHAGLIVTPLPILQNQRDGMLELFQRAAADEALRAIGFSSLAQRARTYEDYAQRLRLAQTTDLDLVAVALSGSVRHVNRVAGSLPLWR